jgi:hypothetical protein
MTCLVLSDASDAHAQHVLKSLQLACQDAELLDTRWFPTQAVLAFDPVQRRGHLGLPSGRRLALHDIRSVYWRNYSGVETPALPDSEQDFIAHNDARSLMESLLDCLPCRWVNGWSGFQLHQRKPAALARVAALGVDVPATLCTNHPTALRQFAAQHPRAIFKPIQGGAHARRLTAEYLDEQHLANLQIAPVTVQEEIEGTSVRVFVAGPQIHACEIRTGELDYRDDESPQLTALPLDSAFASLCRRIAQTLELLWAGIDFIRRHDGRYVFLEANPSPMFLGFERDTGLPLTDSLLRLLIDGREDAGNGP